MANREVVEQTPSLVKIVKGTANRKETRAWFSERYGSNEWLNLGKRENEMLECLEAHFLCEFSQVDIKAQTSTTTDIKAILSNETIACLAREMLIGYYGFIRKPILQVSAWLNGTLIMQVFVGNPVNQFYEKHAENLRRIAMNEPVPAQEVYQLFDELYNARAIQHLGQKIDRKLMDQAWQKVWYTGHAWLFDNKLEFGYEVSRYFKFIQFNLEEKKEKPEKKLPEKIEKKK